MRLPKIGANRNCRKGRGGFGKPDPFYLEALFRSLARVPTTRKLGHTGRAARVGVGDFGRHASAGRLMELPAIRLNHLDLHVPDVAATRDVLVSAFGLIEIETRGVNGLAILRDHAGLELVISRPIEKFGGADSASVGRNTYHIGFILPSREAVDEQFERAKSAGCGSGNRLRRCGAGGYFTALRRGEFSSRSVGVQTQQPSQKY